MKISKKQESLLYSVIADKIMDDRVAIGLLFKHLPEYDKIDNILYRLHVDCPEQAIKLFNTKTKQNK